MSVRTRVLILSDTHSALPDKTSHPDTPFSQPFPAADVAIHCGDLTSTGKFEEHQRALALLKSLPAPIKIVIPGNHDLTLDNSYCRSHADRYFHGWNRFHSEDDLEKAYELYTNSEAVQAGIVYLTEGVRLLELPNGAHLKIYASAWTPEFCDWAFPYPRDEDRFNPSRNSIPPNPIPDASQIDIMITHGPPRGILDRTVRNENVGCEHLMKAVERCRPVLHCFGHIHEAWGAEKIAWLVDETQKQPAAKLCIRPLSSKKQVHQSDMISTRTSLIDASSEVPFGQIDGTNLKSGSETVFVNASIMDYHYSPCQKPWLVDLDLASISA